MTNVYTNYSFIWDAGIWPKCGKHGLSKLDIQFALNSARFVQESAGRAYGEQRFQAVCSTEDGANVFVVFVVRNKKIRPISARPMHDKEVRKYDQDFKREG